MLEKSYAEHCVWTGIEDNSLDESVLMWLLGFPFESFYDVMKDFRRYHCLQSEGATSRLEMQLYCA